MLLVLHILHHKLAGVVVPVAFPRFLAYPTKMKLTHRARHVIASLVWTVLLILTNYFGGRTATLDDGALAFGTRLLSKGVYSLRAAGQPIDELRAGTRVMPNSGLCFLFQAAHKAKQFSAATLDLKVRLSVAPVLYNEIALRSIAVDKTLIVMNIRIHNLIAVPHVNVRGSDSHNVLVQQAKAALHGRAFNVVRAIILKHRRDVHLPAVTAHDVPAVQREEHVIRHLVIVANYACGRIAHAVFALGLSCRYTTLAEQTLHVTSLHDAGHVIVYPRKNLNSG
mmetsp:Transcript_2815/g.7804  ORF Transcript_2815/g.7804 Transcript_2815/m.7804 type:complete len:281 (-) Transcript_2815:398-1240(-)